MWIIQDLTASLNESFAKILLSLAVLLIIKEVICRVHMIVNDFMNQNQIPVLLIEKYKKKKLFKIGFSLA